MDIVTYALLKKRIEGLTPGYTYKGSVASTSALPADPEQGDLYTVTGEGNAQYVWDGTAWEKLTNLGLSIVDGKLCVTYEEE